MPDLNFNEIVEDNNIRGSFNQSSDLDYSNTISRNDLNNHSPLQRTQIDSAPLDTGYNQNKIFGLISQNDSRVYEQFEYGSGSGSSSARDLVENGGIGTMNRGEQDLTYYDWPAIDNFEDVDTLFRNCDSTFGESQAMEEDADEDLSWFPNASDAIYSSEIKDTDTWREQSAVEEMMQELIDQKCSLVCPSEPTSSPFGQNQRHQLESGPSSHVTFSSYSGMESIDPPVGTTTLMNTSGAAKEAENKLTLKVPTLQGSKRKCQDSSTVEETSFKQLQNVMIQLDEKTKLSIRDSLYRLARSAQHRNNCSNSSDNNGDGQWSPHTHTFAQPMRNPEKETNPMDRSIAELLFHQPGAEVTSNSEDNGSQKSSVSVSYFVNT